MRQRKIIFEIPEKLSTVQPVVYANESFSEKEFLGGFVFSEAMDNENVNFKNYHWAKNLGIHFRYMQNESGAPYLNFPYISVPDGSTSFKFVVREWNKKGESKPLEEVFGKILLFTNQGNESVALFPHIDEYEEI